MKGMSNMGQRAALSDVARSVTGTSNTGSVQNAVADPAWKKALWALLANQTLGQ
jgi:hypothetical protein